MNAESKGGLSQVADLLDARIDGRSEYDLSRGDRFYLAGVLATLKALGLTGVPDPWSNPETLSALPHKVRELEQQGILLQLLDRRQEQDPRYVYVTHQEQLWGGHASESMTGALNRSQWLVEGHESVTLPLEKSSFAQLSVSLEPYAREFLAASVGAGVHPFVLEVIAQDEDGFPRRAEILAFPAEAYHLMQSFTASGPHP